MANILSFFLTIVIAIVFNTIIRVGYQKKYSILSIFNYSWIYAAIIYIYNPIEYYFLDPTVSFFTLTFVSCVNLGGIIALKKNTGIEFNNSCLDRYQKKKIAMLSITSILIWLVLIPNLMISWNYIAVYGMPALRAAVYGGLLYTTKERLLYQYIVEPIFIATLLYSVQVNLFSPRKSVLIATIALINALVFSILLAGRALFLFLSMYYIFGLIIISQGKIINLLAKHKLKLILLLTILVAIASFSTLRVTREWGLINELILYTTGGVSVFSSVYKTGILDNTRLYGFGFIGGIHDFIGFILMLLGFKVELIAQVYSSFFSEFIDVGKNITTNFTATALATFYLDFGFWGIVFEGILFGFILSKVDNYCSEKTTPSKMCLYLLFSYIAFESLQNYTLKSVVTFNTIIILYLMSRKEELVNQSQVSLESLKSVKKEV